MLLNLAHNRSFPWRSIYRLINIITYGHMKATIHLIVGQVGCQYEGDLNLFIIMVMGDYHIPRIKLYRDAWNVRSKVRLATERVA